MSASLFGYYINLDERGEFYADVRNSAGETICEFHTQDARELIEDGLIKNIRDPHEVGRHLISTGVLPSGSELLSSVEFEKRQAVYESLGGDHYVTVKVRALVKKKDLHEFDRADFGLITGSHIYIINDLERLFDQFHPNDPDEMRGMSPIERARFILTEKALDDYHESFAIKVLEDFEIVAEPSPKAVADGVRHLLTKGREAALSDDRSPGL